MPIVDPLNTASQSHHSLGQLTSATGILPAAGDLMTTSGGPETYIAPTLVQQAKAATGTASSVAGSATSVTLLAANALRKGATLVNESSAILYVMLGTPASATAYTIALPAMGSVGAYYEVPFAYSGIITGIWTSAAGNARVVEIV